MSPSPLVGRLQQKTKGEPKKSARRHKLSQSACVSSILFINIDKQYEYAENIKSGYRKPRPEISGRGALITSFKIVCLLAGEARSQCQYSGKSRSKTRTGQEASVKTGLQSVHSLVAHTRIVVPRGARGQDQIHARTGS